MKIAVVIGISNYENLDSLPACETDAKKTNELLKATQEYVEVVQLTQNTNCREIKSSLRAFFKKYDDKDIEEVFFYLSGHGTYVSDKVLFCCSDFDSNQPSTTALSNQEIDDYVRSVSPKLTVKIFDSCSSGEKYIKDTKDNFEKAIRDTDLHDYICMASSRLDQSSYASNIISDFTKSFIEGVFSIEDGEILYRDIQNHISDAFITKPEQTPQFVLQYTGLEVFAKVNIPLKALKSTFKIGKEKLPEDMDTSIDTKIEEMESIFVPFETVSDSLEQLQFKLSTTGLDDSFVSKYYNYEFEFKNGLDSLVDMGTIASWAYEKNWDKHFFIDIDVVKERRRIGCLSSDYYYGSIGPTGPTGPTGPVGSIGTMFLAHQHEKKEDKTNAPKYRIVKVPTRIKSNHPLAFEAIEIIAKPNKRALKQFGAMIGIVHSRTYFLVLSTTLEYKDVGWDERTIDASTVNWKLKELQWVNIVSDPMIIASDVLPQVEKAVSDYLKSLIKEEEVVIEQQEISEEEVNHV